MTHLTYPNESAEYRKARNALLVEEIALRRQIEAVGDMGCYSFAGVFKILGLTPPTAVEACSGESYEETFPQASIVHLDFPAREGRPEVRMSWYDGGLHPPRPAGITEEDERHFKHR